ncbi:hypothetical protein F2Q69_00034082 [Brassica cretica]|uniref:Uncharacterized protein n=1 Tax=Brassica cretica TaxID=69181 RepID=A0A8S9SLT3_BRACR|nr:hypothetical protein F2Q69_00034082 [Brassica cretica]
MANLRSIFSPSNISDSFQYLNHASPAASVLKGHISTSPIVSTGSLLSTSAFMFKSSPTRRVWLLSQRCIAIVKP